MRQILKTLACAAIAVLLGFGGLLMLDSLKGTPTYAADDGRVDRYADGFRVGSQGTKISNLTVGTIAFTGDTTGTMALPGAEEGDTYVLALSWTSLLNYGASHAIVTYAITADILTVTKIDSPTGTLNVIAIGIP